MIVEAAIIIGAYILMKDRKKKTKPVGGRAAQSTSSESGDDGFSVESDSAKGFISTPPLQSTPLSPAKSGSSLPKNVNPKHQPMPAKLPPTNAPALLPQKSPVSLHPDSPRAQLVQPKILPKVVPSILPPSVGGSVHPASPRALPAQKPTVLPYPNTTTPKFVLPPSKPSSVHPSSPLLKPKLKGW